MHSSLYIPPSQFSFRLLAYGSHYVLSCRTPLDTISTLFHHQKEEEHSGQWFHLIPGEGERAGYYMVKNNHTGAVLFVHSGRIAATTDPNAQYRDPWFRIEEGKDKYAGHFRLRNIASSVIPSAEDLEVHAANQLDSSPDRNRYFSFLFEELVVEGIDYDLEDGIVTASSLKVIAQQTLNNNTELEQTMECQVDERQTHSFTFEYTGGFNLGPGFNLSGGIPNVIGGTLEIDNTLNQQWSFGRTNEYEVGYTATLPVKASPLSTIRAISRVSRGNVIVPFTLRLKSKLTGFKVKTHGIFLGVSTWDIDHTIEHLGSKKSGPVNGEFPKFLYIFSSSDVFILAVF